ncbi:LETM1 domain-containing protein [Wenyingzhuangia sp. 2_MG-2023]|uniref:LETM1 domain-containing protein n=1 Tax=Wenyingzhuangia sp. 2_MG-2023 TaxID=3062639 RepID=UPI0026E443C1|nr:LETM1 domain-containing protein [Wenyingzhuangia sp. 2_MG-2023]MDO6739175.1 LETM1 domain-containing protein [Wenyingzhuangia sp. 2_MG-2023]MDO6803672.1 LETM1 domain-containing protein [Wenyingzhuangia sp. 1_MG-2023]
MTTKRKSKTYRLFRIFIHKNRSKISHALDVFFMGLKNGASDTKKTTTIIQAFVTKGTISKEEEKFLKIYVYDLLKVAGIGIPFVLLPGASIIIPFVIRAAEKRNIDLIPSNFKNKPKEQIKP